MWLRFLTIELSAIDKLIDPQGKVSKKRDHSVGECSDDLKKLYTLWRITDKGADELILKVKYGELNPEEEDVANNIREKKWKASLLEGIFWACIKDEFKLWGKSSIGIRHGFEVVWSEEDQAQGFFKRFFGQGGDDQ